MDKCVKQNETATTSNYLVYTPYSYLMHRQLQIESLLCVIKSMFPFYLQILLATLAIAYRKSISCNYFFTVLETNVLDLYNVAKLVPHHKTHIQNYTYIRYLQS